MLRQEELPFINALATVTISQAVLAELWSPTRGKKKRQFCTDGCAPLLPELAPLPANARANAKPVRRPDRATLQSLLRGAQQPALGPCHCLRPQVPRANKQTLAASNSCPPRAWLHTRLYLPPRTNKVGRSIPRQKFGFVQTHRLHRDGTREYV
jgi:hypothetical protein